VHIASDATIFCDVTQSFSAKGGGVRTFLSEKRKHLLENTNARHCLIIPGTEDKMVIDGRQIRIEIASPQVPGSPNYRLLLRQNAVKAALKEIQPNFIECHDAYNLPWAALRHRAAFPNTVLVAGYHTDFPTVYVEKFGRRYFGNFIAQRLKMFCYRYSTNLYRRFDGFYTLTQSAADYFSAYAIPNTNILTLGADMNCFNPNKRSEDLRRKLGMKPDAPLLIYVGRIDRERKPDIVAQAFKNLPENWGAGLIMIGDGNERARLEKDCAGLNAHFPGFITDREELARYLASADIYVSAMENETFGISIIEAQASGLPTVGVRAGAMVDRVPPSLGRLGAPNNAVEMAENISAVWMNRLSPTGERARLHVQDNFSWNTTFEQLFNTIYPSAIDARNTAINHKYPSINNGLHRKAS